MKIRSIFLTIMFAFLSFSSVFAQDFKNLNAEDVKRLIDQKAKMVIVDVRTEQEYREGHVMKAINIPPEKYAAIASFLPKNKKTLLIFYCRGYG